MYAKVMKIKQISGELDLITLKEKSFFWNRKASTYLMKQGHELEVGDLVECEVEIDRIIYAKRI